MDIVKMNKNAIILDGDAVIAECRVSDVKRVCGEPTRWVKVRDVNAYNRMGK